MKTIKNFLQRIQRYQVIFVVIFFTFVFLRFYDIENRIQFTWDQIQNAWVMKDMLVDHKMPLEGMVVKLNSGFYIGPAYYYLLAPFYFVFNLDPIAGGYFAGLVGVVTVIALYVVTKSLFSTSVALISMGMYTISFHAIISDRIAWPVVFIPLVSLLIFYFLYKSVMVGEKYLLYLAAVLGFSFHIHFTSIFYIMILLCTMPLLIRRKIAWKYYVLSTFIFLVWFIPNILAEGFKNFGSGKNIIRYLNSYYLGIHFRRIMQVFGDSMIEAESTIFFFQLRFLKYVFLPFFLFLYLRRNVTQKRVTFVYLMLLWFFIPLLVFSVYSGEISDYYFSLTRPFAIITIAYVTWFLWRKGFWVIRLLLCLLGIYYTYVNISAFVDKKYSILPQARQNTLQAIRENRRIDFQEGVPESYLYYLYAESPYKITDMK